MNVKKCSACHVIKEVYGSGYCKPCQLRRTAEWKRSNPEKARERQRRYDQARAGTARRLELHRSAGRRYYEAHLDQERLRNRAYRTAHPEVNADQARRRRALVFGGAVREIVRLAVLLERDGLDCYLCGREMLVRVDRYHPLRATVDHIVPLSRGGEHSYANARPMCRECNLRKGTRKGPRLSRDRPASLQFRMDIPL